MTIVSFVQQRSTVRRAGPLVMRVSLRINPTPAAPLLVAFQYGGSAVFGSDWFAPDTVTVPAGHASFPVSISIEPGFKVGEFATLQIVDLPAYALGANPKHTITRATAAAKPDSSNTGPNSLILNPMTGATVTTAGAIIEHVLIKGGLKIRAPNVHIRDFKVDASGSDYGIECEVDDAPGLVIEDGEILNMKSAAIYGRNLIARRLELHASDGDAMKLHANALVEGCYIHDLGHGAGAHADGNQSRRGSHITFRGNNIDVGISAQPESNSALLFSSELAGIDDILVEENWLNGGNGTVWFEEKQFGKPTNCRLLNNRFGRDYRYFTLLDDGIGTKISGNVWDNTGELMEINHE